jgi:hypothetical protein
VFERCWSVLLGELSAGWSVGLSRCGCLGYGGWAVSRVPSPVGEYQDDQGETGPSDTTVGRGWPSVI